MVASCSDDRTAAPPDNTTPTTAVGPSTTLVDSAGKPLPTDTLTALITKLSGSPSTEAALAPEVASALRTVQLEAVGLTAEQAGCVEKRMAEQARTTPTQPATIGGASAMPSGLDPTTIGACIDAAGLSKLAGQSPDLSRVSPGQLRPVIAAILTATLTAAGFTSPEAVCVVDKGIGSVTDQQLATLLTGNVPEVPIRVGIAACLTGDRVRQLAG
jgi:hypothetical protein